MDPQGPEYGRPISLHRYLYGSNNPASRVDPTGRLDFAEVTAVGAIIGIGATLAGCNPSGVTGRDSGVTQRRLPGSTARVSPCVQNLLAPWFVGYSVPYDRVTIRYVKPGDPDLHGNDAEEKSYGNNPVQYQISWTTAPKLSLDAMSNDSLGLLAHELFHVKQELRAGGKMDPQYFLDNRGTLEAEAYDFQATIKAQYAGQTPCPSGVDP
jgi:hypothetical protein